MSEVVETMCKLRDLVERGILSHNELANAFFAKSEPQSVVANWLELPDDLKDIIVNFLGIYPAGTLRAFPIGPPSAAVIEELSAKMNEAAHALTEYFGKATPTA